MLGAMIRDLGNPSANDMAAHHENLLEYARQYLQSRGPVDKVSGRMRCTYEPRRTYLVSEQTDFRKKQLVFKRETNFDQTEMPGLTRLLKWYIEGEPPLTACHHLAPMNASLLPHLIEQAIILPQNLEVSCSALCLAGRAAGEEASKKVCENVWFQAEETEQSLADLLSIPGWSSSDIARVCFFNLRTEKLACHAAKPATIVADGDASLLTVLDKFQKSNIVGVIPRTMERERLDGIRDKIVSLRSWYEQDEEALYNLPAVPRGIAVSILKRRAS